MNCSRFFKSPRYNNEKEDTTTMKKTLKMIGMTVLLSLSCLTMTAQLDGSGFYRIRNAANTNHYISLANDLFNYHTVISNAGGGLTQLYFTQAAKNRAMACAGLYLQTDIHLVDDSEYINPGAVIYAEQKVANGQYNLIGQGTSLLTLTRANEFALLSLNRSLSSSQVYRYRPQLSLRTGPRP